MRRAIGTSLLIIALVAASGFVTHALISPTLPWHQLVLLGAGAMAGMLVGSLVAERVSAGWLQRSFALCLLCLAAVTLVSAWS